MKRMKMNAAARAAADDISRLLAGTAAPAARAPARAGREIVLEGVVGLDFTASGLREALAQDDGDVVVRVNSPGGLVFEGFSAFNALSRHPGHVTVVVEGLAASAASWLPMAADEAVMPRASMLMIHQAHGLTIGNADDHATQMEALRRMDDLQAAIYAERTGMPEAEVRALMAAETYFTAEEAIEKGFAHRMEERRAAPAARAPSGLTQLRAQGPVALATKIPAAGGPRAEAPPVAPAQAEQQEAGMADKDNGAGKPAPQDAPKQEPQVVPPTPTPNTQPTPANEPVIHPAGAHLEQAATLPELQALAARASMSSDWIVQQLASKASLAQAKDAIIDGRATPARPTAYFHGARDLAVEGFRAGAEAALLARVGKAKPTAEARPYMGLSLIEMARASISAAGGRPAGMSPEDIAGAALNRRGYMASAGLQTTSDFPLLLANVARKVLLDAYEQAPQDWRPLVRVVSHSDYKPVSYLRMSEAPELLRTGEHQPYTYGGVSENGESFAISKWGRMIGITREALVNDDLGALTRFPEMFGRAASYAMTTAFWSILTSNPTMSDGVSLFHANHGNLAGTGGAINATTIAAARKAMRVQKGLEGRPIVVQPRYLVVSPDKETEAQQFLQTINNADNTTNIFRNSLDLIVSPFLTGNAWYLMADPAAQEGIFFAFLNGVQAPDVREEEDITIDGMSLRVRLEFGAAPIDWRGLYRNPGA
jgi:ATP-dependent protease ClpP protease subunit/phage major head subunit gpT-like protein